MVTLVRIQKYCGILTNCSANVTCDGLKQMGGGGVFEIGMTM